MSRAEFTVRIDRGTPSFVINIVSYDELVSYIATFSVEDCILQFKESFRNMSPIFFEILILLSNILINGVFRSQIA
jgi:hypothetical protein